jgi:hypothetical protein
MTFRVEIVCLHDGGEQRCSVVEMEREELALETLGMSVAEGKAILHGIQDLVAGQQVIEDLQRKRVCPNCGQRYHSKDAATHTVKTVFGAVEVPHPRWESCPCQSEGPRTFRPTTGWLQGARTSPEMLYLETKWASLMPFEKVVDLLKEVLRWPRRLIRKRSANICMPWPNASNRNSGKSARLVILRPWRPSRNSLCRTVP